MTTVDTPFSNRILVVEDDFSLVPLLDKMIRAIVPNSTIDWASSAEEAYRLIEMKSEKIDRKPQKYNLVLTDFHLSGNKTGFDLVRDCALNDIGANFVMTSADDKIKTNLPFLKKPFRKEDLKSKIQEFIAFNPLEQISVQSAGPIKTITHEELSDELISAGKRTNQILSQFLFESLSRINPRLTDQWIDRLSFAMIVASALYVAVFVPLYISRLPFGH